MVENVLVRLSQAVAGSWLGQKPKSYHVNGLQKARDNRPKRRVSFPPSQGVWWCLCVGDSSGPNLEVQADHREPRLEFAHHESNKERLFKGAFAVVSGRPIIVTSFAKSHPAVLSVCFENNTAISSYLEMLKGFHMESYHVSHVFPCVEKGF